MTSQTEQGHLDGIVNWDEDYFQTCKTQPFCLWDPSPSLLVHILFTSSSPRILIELFNNSNIDQFLTILEHPWWLIRALRMGGLQEWKIGKFPQRAGNAASEVVVQIQANQSLWHVKMNTQSYHIRHKLKTIFMDTENFSIITI
jgi:hypothetical protein